MENELTPQGGAHRSKIHLEGLMERPDGPGRGVGSLQHFVPHRAGRVPRRRQAGNVADRRHQVHHPRIPASGAVPSLPPPHARPGQHAERHVIRQPRECHRHLRAVEPVALYVRSVPVRAWTTDNRLTATLRTHDPRSATFDTRHNATGSALCAGCGSPGTAATARPACPGGRAARRARRGGRWRSCESRRECGRGSVFH